MWPQEAAYTGNTWKRFGAWHSGIFRCSKTPSVDCIARLVKCQQAETVLTPAINFLSSDAARSFQAELAKHGARSNQKPLAICKVAAALGVCCDVSGNNKSLYIGFNPIDHTESYINKNHKTKTICHCQDS